MDHLLNISSTTLSVLVCAMTGMHNTTDSVSVSFIAQLVISTTSRWMCSCVCSALQVPEAWEFGECKVKSIEAANCLMRWWEVTPCCLVDLLCRAGFAYQEMEFIRACLSSLEKTHRLIWLRSRWQNKIKRSGTQTHWAHALLSTSVERQLNKLRIAETRNKNHKNAEISHQCSVIKRKELMTTWKVSS